MVNATTATTATTTTTDATATMARTEPRQSAAAVGTDAEAPSFAVAGRLLDALAVRDFDAVAATLTDDVRFRALLPHRLLEADGADSAREAFNTWFGGADRCEMTEAVLGEVGGRIHLRWRLRVTDSGRGDDTFVVEQQVYADAAPDGRLCDVSLLCTGYRAEAS